MLPSAFRFFEDLARFPGQPVSPGTIQNPRTASAFPRHPILKTLLRASSAPSASSLPVSWWSSSTLSCWKIALPLFLIILNSDASLPGIHKFWCVEMMYLLWKLADAPGVMIPNGALSWPVWYLVADEMPGHFDRRSDEYASLGDPFVAAAVPFQARIGGTGVSGVRGGRCASHLVSSS